MHIAVTGANGFVGRNLVRDLEAFGLDIAPVSRAPFAQPDWRASPSLDEPAGPHEWKRVFDGVDAIVHAAARVHLMKDRVAEPLAAFRLVNRDGAIAMAEGAAMAGVRRIVFLSSVKVLGESTSGRAPFSNEDSPAPEDAYAISKLEAEDALSALAERLGFELVVLRLPLVYGPGVGGNMATLIRLLQLGLWLPFPSASTNLRSMISTLNLSAAVYGALTAPAASGARLLVSDGDDISTRKLLHLLGEAAGRPAKLFPVPISVMRLFLDSTGQRALAVRLLGDLRVDIGEAMERLAWSPKLSVAEGMAKIFEWKRGEFYTGGNSHG